MLKKVSAWILCLLILTGSLAGCGKKESPYSRDSKTGDSVYADIIAIKPVYSIGSFNYAVDTVCKARTAQGETIWIYMSHDEYTENFDPTADLGDSYFQKSKYSVCTTPTRVHGFVHHTSSIASNLSTTTGWDHVLHFSSVSASEFDESAATALTPVVFSQEAEELQTVHAQIESITHTFWRYDGNGEAEENKTGCITECITPEGDTVFLYVPIDEYPELFYHVDTGNTPITITGCARRVDDFPNSIPQILGYTMLIHVTQIG